MNKKHKAKKKNYSHLIPDSLAERIKQGRKRLGWTQTELARRAGLTQTDISRIESRKEEKSRVILTLEALDIPYIFAMDKLDADLLMEFQDLSRDDKINVLRLIVRLKNTPEKTQEIVRNIIKDVS